jgi:hypothetical protein
MKWGAAAILAGAGIWAGATLAFFTRGTDWRWIAAAIAVEGDRRGHNASDIRGAAGLHTIARISRYGAASSWRVSDSSWGSSWRPSRGRSVADDPDLRLHPRTRRTPLVSLLYIMKMPLEGKTPKFGRISHPDDASELHGPL